MPRRRSPGAGTTRISDSVPAAVMRELFFPGANLHADALALRPRPVAVYT
jgi:hypothetical protein